MKRKLIYAICGIIFSIIILLVYINKISFENSTKQDENDKYKYHYVLITDKANESFWENVKNAASKYGKANGAYVDVMGQGIAANYSQYELLEIAIESKVDGIILEGTADDKQIELINRARKEEIPVITMVNDNYGSRRLSFIGIGNYNLGREYAREVIKISDKETKRVVVLIDAAVDDTNANLLLNGFEDTVTYEGNHLEFNTELIEVDSADNFSAQQTIRDVLIKDENKPDVIICVNENTTQNAYQAVVDYNLVGQVNIVGYFASDNVLLAINKGGICATVTLDAKEMGVTAVKALNEYHELGRVSEYLTTEAKVINKSNIMEYLKNDSKD